MYTTSGSDENQSMQPPAAGWKGNVFIADTEQIEFIAEQISVTSCNKTTFAEARNWVGEGWMGQPGAPFFV